MGLASQPLHTQPGPQPLTQLEDEAEGLQGEQTSTASGGGNRVGLGAGFSHSSASLLCDLGQAANPFCSSLHPTHPGMPPLESLSKAKA